MKRALERYHRSEARVLPISLRPVDWAGLPFARLQALPKDAKPITTWANQDEAFFDVTGGIRETVFQVKPATQSLPMANSVFRTRLTESLELWTLALNVATTNVDGRTLKSILDALR